MVRDYGLQPEANVTWIGLIFSAIGRDIRVDLMLSECTHLARVPLDNKVARGDREIQMRGHW